MKRPSHTTVAAYAALVLAMSGTAAAATGGTFILGHANSAGKTTKLNNTGPGAALSLHAAKPTTPALSVNTTAQIAKLNASYLNGMTSAGVRPIVFARQNASAALLGPDWTDVTGMSGTIRIPAGRSRPTLFSYSAECLLTGGGDGDSAAIQILVDGAAVTPEATNSVDFAFCTRDSGTLWVGAATQGYALLKPGTHTIDVQVGTTDPGGSARARLDDMQLSAVAY